MRPTFTKNKTIIAYAPKNSTWNFIFTKKNFLKAEIICDM